MSFRLKQSDITFRDVMKMSMKYYKSSKGDDKSERAKMDIISARITARKNLQYDRSSKIYVQSGRDIKIEFTIKTDPLSYKKRDTLKFHYYPVTFLIHDIEKGIDSSIRWRTGSLKKPLFSKKGDSKIKREKIEKQNIKNRVQLQFFFELEWVLKENNLLYGRNWAKWKPKVTNKSNKIFFDKHAFFLAKNIVFKLLTTRKTLLRRILNEDRKPL